MCALLRWCWLSLVIAGCGDAGRRPLGATCGADGECATGLCIAGTCLDPDGDADLDGLINRIEGVLGTDPLVRDSDGDGINDRDEIGVDLANPGDTDGDGKVDALESKTHDADGDCITDQLDADDALPETDPARLARALCLSVGACANALVVASCDGGVATCDYSQVAAFEMPELSCDGVDNDCDGQTDERHSQGGEVTFGGGPYAADAGKPLGALCGIGACVGGTVVCGSDKATLTCSTADRVGPLACASDKDCDGLADESEVANPITDPLAGCSDYFVDADGDRYGAGAGRCLCSPFGAYQVTNRDDCAEADGRRYPMAPGVCGVDADCDLRLEDLGEACDDNNADVTDGCHECTIVARRVDARVGSASDLRVAGLTSGGFVAAWDGGSDALGEVAYGGTLAFFGAAGDLVSREDGRGLGERTHTEQSDLVALPEDFVGVGTWRIDPATGGAYYEVQRYDAIGEPNAKPARVYDALSPLYDVSLVSLGDGGIGFVAIDAQATTTAIVIVRVDREGNTQREVGGRPVPNANDLAALGSADGTVVASWSQYDPETFATTRYTQAFGADGKPVGEPRAFDPGVEVLATSLARRGNGWALFFIARGEDEVGAFSRIGYQAFEGDLAVGNVIYLQQADRDGCPYNVMGGFDAGGYAWAVVDDGECRSPIRGWYAGATTTTLPIFAAALHPNSFVYQGSADAAGAGFVVGYIVGDGQHPGVYVQRFGADGIAVR